MTIKYFISRLSKVMFGVFLIAITLTVDPVQMANSVLFALFGIPFVLAGIFNWTPLVWLIEKTKNHAQFLVSMMKPRMKSVS